MLWMFMADLTLDGGFGVMLRPLLFRGSPVQYPSEASGWYMPLTLLLYRKFLILMNSYSSGPT